MVSFCVVASCGATSNLAWQETVFPVRDQETEVLALASNYPDITSFSMC